MIEIVKLYRCSACEKVIQQPENGIVIHGNIYTGTPDNKEILVGNNFPTGDNTSIHMSSIINRVEETALCIPCFLKVLKINLSGSR